MLTIEWLQLDACRYVHNDAFVKCFLILIGSKFEAMLKIEQLILECL